jgi:hypothetical protein
MKRKEKRFVSSSSREKDEPPSKKKKTRETKINQNKPKLTERQQLKLLNVKLDETSSDSSFSSEEEEEEEVKEVKPKIEVRKNIFKKKEKKRNNSCNDLEFIKIRIKQIIW